MQSSDQGLIKGSTSCLCKEVQAFNDCDMCRRNPTLVEITTQKWITPVYDDDECYDFKCLLER